MKRLLLATIAAVSLFPSTAQAVTRCGGASWYGPGLYGNLTANGEVLRPGAYTAAHRSLPYGSRVRVTYRGRSVVVRINDNGPFDESRDLDLSRAAFNALADPGQGHIHVCYARV